MQSHHNRHDPFLTMCKETRQQFNDDGNPGSGDIPEDSLEEGNPEEGIPAEGIQDEDIRDAGGIQGALTTYEDRERSLPPLVTITWRKPH